MKTVLLLLTLLISTATLSYCQTSYPKKILVDKDTVVAITETQLKEINKTFLETEALRAETKVLKTAILQKDSVIANLKEVYVTNNKIDSAYQSQISYYRGIIDLQQQKYGDMKSEFQAQNLLLKKDLRKTNIKSGFLQSAVVITLILLPVLLIK